VKKLIPIAALASCFAAMTLPAGATTATGTVKIGWNVTALLSVTFQGNYTAAGASGSLTPTPVTGNNGGLGTCNGAGGSTGTTTGGAGTNALVLDFGAITPDATHATDCLVLNTDEAVVNTNDTLGVTVAEALTTAPSNASVLLCGNAVKNHAPVTFATAATASSSTNWGVGTATDTTSTGTLAGTTCAGLTETATLNMTTIGASQNTFKTNDDTTNPAYFGSDLALIIPANAAQTAGDAGTITYTVTAN
jgi:hypothetical protein